MHTAWHALSATDALQKQESRKEGLHPQEVRDRLKNFGPNALPEKRPAPLLTLLWAQFKSPLVFVLFAAAVVTAFVREWADFGVIMAAMIINTVLGFIQEYKADRSVDALQRMVQVQARVRRGGEVTLIPANEVVPGDILILREGDRVPADARLIVLNELETEEAQLTGESQPVNKKIEKVPADTPLADRVAMVFMGTMVGHGVGEAVAVETGIHTEIGRLAALVSETEEEKTPLQLQLGRLARLLGVFAGAVVVFLVVIGLVRDFSFFDIFLTAVAVAVAAIPEGLLVAVTVILTIGMQRILQKKALVRKLVAAETLGSVSVICTDKTGTLTEGRMRVVRIVTEDGGGKPEKELLHHVHALRIAVIANDGIVKTETDGVVAARVLGEPTERALLEAGLEIGIDQRVLAHEEVRLAEIPFEHKRKFMATLNAKPGHPTAIIFVKGAPEVLLEKSDRVQKDGDVIPLTDQQRSRWLGRADELTSQGLRVLAVAEKHLHERSHEFHEGAVAGLTFVGLIALQDPLRIEARETIALCRTAGIRPVLITGDHRLTAAAIAREAGIAVDDHRVIEGRELDTWSDAELRERVAHVTVFARVDPTHKLRIVDAWQANGEVVAMTGDGVNDAPALKSADIGIALGSGTDVTKQTADIVLLDDNFKTIVDAVRQGRVIFSNVRKVVTYLLTDSFSEIVLIGGSILLGLPLPLLPAQILWINLITDGFPDLALTAEPAEDEVMKQRPRKRGEPIVNAQMKVLIFVVGILTDLGLFAIFLWLLSAGSYSLPHIQTIMFVALGMDSLFYVFAIRSLNRSIFSMNPFSNRWLLLAVFCGFVLQVLPIYWEPLQQIVRTVPLGGLEWMILIGAALVKLFAIELAKVVTRRVDRLQEAVVNS